MGTFQEVVAPDIDALIAFTVRQVEHNDAAVGPAVKSVRQALKALLACGIPDLDRHNLACFSFDLFLHEICTYRRLLRDAGLTVLERVDYARLADARVADNDYFQILLFAAISGSCGGLPNSAIGPPSLIWPIGEVGASFNVL